MACLQPQQHITISRLHSFVEEKDRSRHPPRVKVWYADPNSVADADACKASKSAHRSG